MIKNHCKSLGLIIDTKIRFKEHITYKLQRAYSSLKLIYNQRHYLDRDVKKMLCDSLVLSHFDHCDSVYGPCLDNYDIRRIQKVQNSCIRLIYGIRRRQRISHKLKDSSWLNMYNRRRLHMACLFFKIIKSNAPSYLHNKLTYRTDVHNINVRRKNFLTIPRHHKEIFKRSYSYNVAACVNGLMKFDFLNFNASFLSFKFNYKKYLLSIQ